MLAYANREAVETTMKTKLATYWSRSRNELWKKGDTSGHIQRVRRVLVEEVAGEALLGGVGMYDGYAADRLVRRNDVDHTPDAELRKGNLRHGRQRGLEIERIAQTATGFGEEGETRPIARFGAERFTISFAAAGRGKGAEKRSLRRHGELSEEEGVARSAKAQGTC